MFFSSDYQFFPHYTLGERTAARFLRLFTSDSPEFGCVLTASCALTSQRANSSAATTSACPLAAARWRAFLPPCKEGHASFSERVLKARTLPLASIAGISLNPGFNVILSAPTVPSPTPHNRPVRFHPFWPSIIHKLRDAWTVRRFRSNLLFP